MQLLLGLFRAIWGLIKFAWFMFLLVGNILLVVWSGGLWLIAILVYWFLTRKK